MPEKHEKVEKQPEQQEKVEKSRKSRKHIETTLKTYLYEKNLNYKKNSGFSGSHM